MNSKVVKRLNEYLDSECGDYGMSYKWEYNHDKECIDVEISAEHTDNIAHLAMNYSEDEVGLFIEVGEDSWYKTCEYDETVKYFWMLVSPKLFT